jgi:hypothetical protein
MSFAEFSIVDDGQARNFVELLQQVRAVSLVIPENGQLSLKVFMK